MSHTLTLGRATPASPADLQISLLPKAQKLNTDFYHRSTRDNYPSEDHKHAKIRSLWASRTNLCSSRSPTSDYLGQLFVQDTIFAAKDKKPVASPCAV